MGTNAITSERVRDLNSGFSGIFQAAYDMTETFEAKISVHVTSNGPQNVYAWLAQLPKMRKWLGPRVVRALATHDHIIVNDDYELTFSIKTNDLKDDNLGVYNPKVTMIGQQARRLWDDLVARLLINGQSERCYDGQYFFDANHPINPHDTSSDVQSNYFTGRALTEANLDFVRQKMVSFKGDNGRPLRVRPNILLVGSTLETTARKLVETALVGGGNTNIYSRLGLEVMVVPELDDEPTAWYLLDTRKAIKPFVTQVREAPHLVMPTFTDESALDEKLLKYRVDARGAAGYALWFLATKAVA